MSCGTVITSFPMALHELPIVLASASERRRSILNTMGWKRVRQCPCAVYQEALDPKTFATAADYAKENARQKGSEIAERFGYLRERAQSQNDFHDHAVCPVVIAADTVVSFFDQIIEKPKDREDAIKIIKLLSGYEDAVSYQRPVSRRTHNVVTGVALYYNKVLLELFSVETKVIFAPLTLKDINEYVDHNEYMDKAGGYGIQSLGACLVESIEGCFYNVQGLPAFELSKRISQLLSNHRVRSPLPNTVCQSSSQKEVPI